MSTRYFFDITSSDLSYWRPRLYLVKLFPKTVILQIKIEVMRRYGVVAILAAFIARRGISTTKIINLFKEASNWSFLFLLYWNRFLANS